MGKKIGITMDIALGYRDPAWVMLVLKRRVIAGQQGRSRGRGCVSEQLFPGERGGTLIGVCHAKNSEIAVSMISLYASCLIDNANGARKKKCPAKF